MLYMITPLCLFDVDVSTVCKGLKWQCSVSVPAFGSMSVILILEVTKKEQMCLHCRISSLHSDWRPRFRRASSADPTCRADGWRRVWVPGCPGCHEVPSCPPHCAGWVQIKHVQTPKNATALARAASNHWGSKRLMEKASCSLNQTNITTPVFIGSMHTIVALSNWAALICCQSSMTIGHFASSQMSILLILSIGQKRHQAASKLGASQY